ncbi:MAG TPA: hypothetical protein VG897_16420 [Terriglobales bacterium]|nr:hypothetical protein [Terriglobales bacterium]
MKWGSCGGGTLPYNFRQLGTAGTPAIEIIGVRPQHDGMYLRVFVLVIVPALLWTSRRIMIHRQNQQRLRVMRLHLERLESGQD